MQEQKEDQVMLIHAAAQKFPELAVPDDIANRSPGSQPKG